MGSRVGEIRDARKYNPENEEDSVAEAEVEQLIAGSEPPVVIRDDDDDDKIDELKRIISVLQQNQLLTSQAQWNTVARVPEQMAALAQRAQTDIGALTPTQLLQLGGAYYLGFGVPQNPTTAFRCCEQAAIAGFPQAMLILGNCYEVGYGVFPDNRKAIYWYNLAATSADSNAAQAARTALNRIGSRTF